VGKSVEGRTFTTRKESLQGRKKRSTWAHKGKEKTRQGGKPPGISEKSGFKKNGSEQTASGRRTKNEGPKGANKKKTKEKKDRVATTRGTQSEDSTYPKKIFQV